MTTHPTHLLTFGQAADRLGVEVTTIRRWVRSEQAPVVRDGRKVRIPASFCDGLIAQGWQR